MLLMLSQILVTYISKSKTHFHHILDTLIQSSAMRIQERQDFIGHWNSRCKQIPAIYDVDFTLLKQ